MRTLKCLIGINERRIIMKKILAIVLMLALLAPAAVAETGIDINDLSQHVTISLFSNAQNRAERDLEDDYIRQQLQKDLNIDFDMVCRPREEYDTALNLAITGGSVADIFYVSETQYEAFAPSGLFLDLKPYLQYMPTYSAAFPGIAEQESILYDGHMYMIGNKNYRDADQYVSSYRCLWIRQDWLDALNLKAPTTLEEFYDVAYAFTYNDPDKNGQDDTIGFSGFAGAAGSEAAMFPFVFGAYGVGAPTSYIMTDDGVKLSAEVEGTKDALAFIKKMIDNKLVDPDVLSYANYNQFNEMIYKNKVGMIFFSWANFIKSQFGEQLRTLCPDAQWVTLPTVKGPEGHAYLENYMVPGRVTSGYVVNAKVAEDPVKLARVLKYLDYISDGPGYRLVSYGIEGRHFTVNEDGSINVNFELASETENGAQHQVCDRKEKEYLLTKFADIKEEVEFAAYEPRIGDYTSFLPNVDGLNKADWKRYIQENVVKFIYGNRSLDEYDAFIDSLYKVYGQAEYNEALHANLVEAGIEK